MGLRFNEMSGNWLRLMLGQAELANEWQQGLFRAGSVTTGALAATQKQARELLELMGHSTRAKVGLMEQAIDAAQAPGVFQSQAKWLAFWMDALRLAQSNATALTQINSRAANSWLRLIANHKGAGASH